MTYRHNPDVKRARWPHARDHGQPPVNSITSPVVKVELPETRNAISCQTSHAKGGHGDMQLARAAVDAAKAAVN